MIMSDVIDLNKVIQDKKGTDPNPSQILRELANILDDAERDGFEIDVIAVFDSLTVEGHGFTQVVDSYTRGDSAGLLSRGMHIVNAARYEGFNAKG